MADVLLTSPRRRHGGIRKTCVNIVRVAGHLVKLDDRLGMRRHNILRGLDELALEEMTMNRWLGKMDE